MSTMAMFDSASQRLIVHKLNRIALFLCARVSAGRVVAFDTLSRRIEDIIGSTPSAESVS